MPRGGGRAPKKNYKGKSRHFTDEESLRQAAEKEQREKQWRKQRGEDEEEEVGAEGGKKEESGSSSSEESDSDDDRHKGVSHLIDIENPNRVANKTKKITDVDNNASGPQLTRREREELAKQRAAENYQKLHREGKTEEARNDLARLAIIRKQREEAAKKKEAERKAKEDASKKS